MRLRPPRRTRCGLCLADLVRLAAIPDQYRSTGDWAQDSRPASPRRLSQSWCGTVRIGPPATAGVRVPRHQVRLPKQWSNHVKSGILHAIALASVALSYARGGARGERRLRAQLDQAATEIALLREELSIKDDRWGRAHPRRRPHYTPSQRMRILQLRAARGWTLEKTARVFLVEDQTMINWMSQLD